MNVYLDDERPTPPGYVHARWPKDVINLLKTNSIEILSLDHDLGDDQRGTGYDVLLWLEQEVVTKGFQPPKTIVVHSANVSARQKMESAIRKIYQLAEKFS